MNTHFEFFFDDSLILQKTKLSQAIRNVTVGNFN